MIPKRADELLGGGSLYWVIKGNVQCRQRLVEVRPFTDTEGISRCRLVLDPQVVRTDWQPRRAFQGWRYLKAADAPADLGQGDGNLSSMPPRPEARAGRTRPSVSALARAAKAAHVFMNE